jgi:hypothetical protein
VRKMGMLKSRLYRMIKGGI